MPSNIGITASGIAAVAPTLSISSTTNYNQNRATFNAVVNPNGAPTSVKFQYSTNGSTWTDSGTVSGLTGNSQSVYYNHSSSALAVGTLYYVRAVATNSAGVTTSGSTSFTTWSGQTFDQYSSAGTWSFTIPTITPTGGSIIAPTIYNVLVCGGGGFGNWGGGGGGGYYTANSLTFASGSSTGITAAVGGGGGGCGAGGGHSYVSMAGTGTWYGYGGGSGSCDHTNAYGGGSGNGYGGGGGMIDYYKGDWLGTAGGGGGGAAGYGQSGYVSSDYQGGNGGAAALISVSTSEFGGSSFYAGGGGGGLGYNAFTGAWHNGSSGGGHGQGGYWAAGGVGRTHFKYYAPSALA